MKHFLNGFAPLAVATIVGILIAVPLRSPLASAAVFALWGMGWAVIVGLVARSAQWRTPSLLPLLSLIPLFLHFFTQVPVPLWAPATLLLVVILAERQARARRSGPMTARTT